MKVELEVSCCMCERTHKSEIELPDGWNLRYGSVDVESGFCPDHIKIAEFADAQCPGCVGGWMDCQLWRDFAYNRNRKLTESDFEVMRKGICPRRTNGTGFFNSNTGEHGRINLSEKATDESGLVLEKAIKDYWEKYPEE